MDITQTEQSLLAEITRRREALGWSIARLAREAGLPRETVSRVLSGRQRASLRVWSQLDETTRKSRTA